MAGKRLAPPYSRVRRKTGLKRELGLSLLIGRAPGRDKKAACWAPGGQQGMAKRGYKELDELTSEAQQLSQKSPETAASGRSPTTPAGGRLLNAQAVC